MVLTVTIQTERYCLYDSTVTFTISDNHIEKVSGKDMHIPKPDGTFLMTCDGSNGGGSPMDSLWETCHNIIWYNNSLVNSLLNYKTKVHSFLPWSAINTLPIRIGLYQQIFKAGEGVIFMTGEALYFES